MQPRVGVIGAGHAGVEAARTAAARGASVVLFSAESTPPYFRPRLPALAFGQTTEKDILQHPPDWYPANGIDLRLGAAVGDFAASPAAVGKEAFDALIVATGAGPILPDYVRLAPGMILPLWNEEDALRIRGKARAGAPLVVIGGGIIGIETALRAADAGMKVTLVEKMERLMPGYFGPGGSAVLAALLERKGIRVRVSRSVSAVRGGGAALDLDGGESLETNLTIVSIGARRDPALAARAGLRTDRGIVVDAAQRTSAERVFACGDIAQIGGGPSRCSVPETLAQGKVAGHNACGAPPFLAHEPRPVALSFKYKDVELRSGGRPAAGPSEEVPLEGGGGSVHRVKIVKGGAVVGVQMIGDCRDFEKHMKTIQEGRA